MYIIVPSGLKFIPLIWVVLVDTSNSCLKVKNACALVVVIKLNINTSIILFIIIKLYVLLKYIMLYQE